MKLFIHEPGAPFQGTTSSTYQSRYAADDAAYFDALAEGLTNLKETINRNKRPTRSCFAQESFWGQPDGSLACHDGVVERWITDAIRRAKEVADFCRSKGEDVIVRKAANQIIAILNNKSNGINTCDLRQKVRDVVEHYFG